LHLPNPNRTPNPNPNPNSNPNPNRNRNPNPNPNQVAPGNARRIFTGIDIEAEGCNVLDLVWSTLTDYNNLAHVVPNLVSVRVSVRVRLRLRLRLRLRVAG